MANVDTLPKLALLPLRDSYSPTLGDDVITTQYTHGMPRQRLGGVGSPHQAEVVFRHKSAHQDYMLAFWRLYRTKAFAARLILDSAGLNWYECRFIGSPSPREVGPNAFEFSIGLVCRPNPLNLDLDATLVYFYDATGGDISSFTNQLEKLVNEDLPDALGSLNA